MLMELNYHPFFPTVTDTPTNVTSVRTGIYIVKLSWSAPANNAPSVTGFEVFYAESGSNVTQSGGTTTIGTTTINVTLPTLDVMYHIFVVAFSDVGNALPSERSNNSTILLTKPGLLITSAFSNQSVLVAIWP